MKSLRTIDIEARVNRNLTFALVSTLVSACAGTGFAEQPPGTRAASDVLYLRSNFPTALAKNEAGQRLPLSEVPTTIGPAGGVHGCVDCQWLNDATRASEKAFLVMPPKKASDYLQLEFPLRLDPALAYSVGVKLGLPAAGKRATEKAIVSFYAMADKSDATDAPWEHLRTNIEVKPTGKPFEVWIPLGIMPLRRNFRLGITIRNSADAGTPAVLIDYLQVRSARFRPEYGINIETHDSTPDEYVEREIDEAVRLGAYSIRMALPHPIIDKNALTPRQTKRLQLMAGRQAAHGEALRFHVGFGSKETDFDDPATSRGENAAAFQDVCGWGPAYKISRIQPARWANRLRQTLEALRDRGIRVHAVDVFNEPDYACFNGDIPINAVPTVEQIRPSFVMMGRLFGVARTIIKEIYPEARVVGANLANSKLLAGVSGVGLVAPQIIVSILRNDAGVDHIARDLDDFGVHLYHAPEKLLPALTLYRDMLPRDVPVSITEWGYYYSDQCGAPSAWCERNGTARPRYERMKDYLQRANSAPLPVTELLTWNLYNQLGRPTLTGVGGRYEEKLLGEYEGQRLSPR